jgi:hypothetical protein
MVMASKLDHMDSKVKAFLGAELSHAPMYEAYVRELWETYRALGLPNDDFVAELISGKKASLLQRSGK